jgi:hypothetical protein
MGKLSQQPCHPGTLRIARKVRVYFHVVANSKFGRMPLRTSVCNAKSGLNDTACHHLKVAEKVL